MHRIIDVPQGPDCKSRRDCVPHDQDACGRWGSARWRFTPKPISIHLHVRRPTKLLLIGAAASGTELPVGGRDLSKPRRQTGAEAIHPGYGFLSENADFAEACAHQGLVFIGPTPEQMRAFGLKHTAREMAIANGVPLLPGTGLLSGFEEAAGEAERIGYPVMLKSTAGGGGIGMRLCRDAGGATREL